MSSTSLDDPHSKLSSSSSGSSASYGSSLEHTAPVGMMAHTPSLIANAPIISPGAYHPEQLRLSTVSDGVSPFGASSPTSAVASPTSPGAPASTVVRPSLVSKPPTQPLPSFVYVPSNLRYFAVGFFQIFGIWLLYTFTAWTIGVPWQVFLKLRDINENSEDKEIDTAQAILLFIWIMPAYAILFPFSLAVTIVVKWLLIGRYKEGRYKLWSFYYFRWWFVQRIIGLVPLVYLRGSILMNWYARLMGMKLGKDVYLNTFNFDAWDLISIDDDASVGCDAHVGNFHVEHGYLTISRVSIGKRAYIGARAIVQGNMEDDSQLGAMSLLSHGKTVQANEAWRGSPAKKVGVVENIYQKEREHAKNESDSSSSYQPVRSAGGLNSSSSSSLSEGLLSSDSTSISISDGDDDPSLRIARYGRPSTCRLVTQAMIQFFFICGFLSAIILISAVPGLICIHYIMDLPNSDLFPSFDKKQEVWQYIAVVPCMGITFVLAFCSQITIWKWIIMRSVKPGHYWIYSFWYLRKWMIDCLLQLSLHTVYTMYATMYLPPWLRTLGAKLGAGTEVSTAADYAPDLLDIGDGCFVADSVYLGVPTVYMGQVRMAKLKVGSHTFLGNGAVCNLDADIGSDSLLGVMSVPPTVKLSKEEAKAPITWPESTAKIADSTSHLGVPPMLLPNRATAQGSFDLASTFKPTRWLYAKRLTYEFFRITLPFMFMSLCMLLYMGNFEAMLFKYQDTYSGLAFFWLLIWPSCYVAAAFACCFIVIVMKWVFVGAYEKSENPLWSSFVWRTELCVGVMEALANPFFINHIRGTPFICAWFRMLGSTIGERVWMDTTQITEPDMIYIGNDVVLQQDCTLQTHLFEDRIMKVGSIKLHNFTAVGTLAVVLYDSEMNEGSTLGDNSLLMKGESLSSWTSYEGVPCAPIRK